MTLCLLIFYFKSDVVYGVGWKFFSKADEKTITHGVLVSVKVLITYSD